MNLKRLILKCALSCISIDLNPRYLTLALDLPWRCTQTSWVRRPRTSSESSRWSWTVLDFPLRRSWRLHGEKSWRNEHSPDPNGKTTFELQRSTKNSWNFRSLHFRRWTMQKWICIYRNWGLSSELDCSLYVSVVLDFLWGFVWYLLNIQTSISRNKMSKRR